MLVRFCSFLFDDSTSLYTAFCPFKRPLLAISSLCFYGISSLGCMDKPIKPSFAKSVCITFPIFRTLFLAFCPRQAHKWTCNTLFSGSPPSCSFNTSLGKIIRTDQPSANRFWAIEQVRAEAQCGFFAFSADSLSRLFCHVCIYSYLCTIIS